MDHDSGTDGFESRFARREKKATELVNPASGLANDYLNLFNEIVMLIEQLPTMPELMDDMLRWHPLSYQDYFANSVLPGRVSALDAYASLDARFREEFEGVVAELDRKAVGTVAAIRRHHKTFGESQPYALAGICERAGETMREVLRRATNLVNYGVKSPRREPQSIADRLIDGDVRRAG
jgi:hypothetical protein